MTFQEFKIIIGPLAVQLGAEYDLPTWKLYHKALEDIPPALLAASVEAAAQARSKMPSAAQLREFAETRRQVLLKAHPYDGCCECEDHKGWREMLVDGVTRMERCPCRERYAAKLTDLGVTRQPLALLTAAQEPEVGTV